MANKAKAKTKTTDKTDQSNPNSNLEYCAKKRHNNFTCTDDVGLPFLRRHVVRYANHDGFQGCSLFKSGSAWIKMTGRGPIRNRTLQYILHKLLEAQLFFSVSFCFSFPFRALPNVGPRVERLRVERMWFWRTDKHCCQDQYDPHGNEQINCRH